MSSRRRARRRRAEASGSRGSTISVSASRPSARGVGGVDAGVRADEAVMGAADQHAARRADDLADWSSTTCTARASLPCSAASSCARAPGSTPARSTTAPSALETALCATTTIWPSCRSQRALGVQRRRSAPRDRPRRGSRAGRPGYARRGRPISSASQAGARGARGRPSLERVSRSSTALVRGLELLARQPLAQDREVLAGVDVQQQRPGRSIAKLTPAAAQLRWRSQLPGPKLGAIASGGASSRPLVPVPCRSGTITTARARCGRVAAAHRARRGRARDSRPGCTARARIPRPAPRDAECDRRALAVLGGVVDDERALPACGRRDRLLVGHDDRALDRRGFAQRGEHVADHRAYQVRAQRVRDACAEALLGVGEALDGEDRGGAHRLSVPVASQL